ncbi:MAG: hypothetical protein HY261_05440 [Chloroflexi bacterium]|nr:hypothetical protein [Chloroflexota bacterium]
MGPPTGSGQHTDTPSTDASIELFRRGVESERWRGEPRRDIMQCSTHPDVETRLTCQRCEKPICPRCMVQTPVGYRCRECARVQKNPLTTLKGQEAAQVLAVAVAVAFAGGIAWGLIKPLFGLLSIIAALGIGYAIAEVISRAANRRPVSYLPLIAAVAALGAFLIGNVADWIFWIEVRHLVVGPGGSVLIATEKAPLSEAIKHVFDFSVRNTTWSVLSMLLSVAVAYYRFR